MIRTKEWTHISRDLVCLSSAVSAAEPRVDLLLKSVRLEMSVVWVFNESKMKCNTLK